MPNNDCYILVNDVYVRIKHERLTPARARACIYRYLLKRIVTVEYILYFNT